MRTQFFRVDGADQQTGQETYLVLQADNKPQAERLAREQGLLISAVRVARKDDWESAPAEAAVEAPPAEPEPFVDSTVAAAVAPAPVQPVAAAPEPATSTPAVVLFCAGGALVIGGVLALVLALWVDRVSGNELQQLSALMRQMIQTVLGSMLVLGGLIVCAIATLFYLSPRDRTG